MMDFVALFQSAQMAMVSIDVGLTDEDNLEATLERAASFSMYLRYSLSVVAPMARSSPRPAPA